ncbi:MAG TPA: DUF3177 domain-containing protein [Cyanobacteria bacterium UBA8156]|jgi:hypothetical protein|nr:DUF3177 domain-containing protein [Cyanobacteria bacterium UBA8156]
MQETKTMDLRQAVWLDFRLAVLFTVIAPLILLGWTFQVKSNPIWRSLVIYWRVSSLLAISVYLLIAANPLAYLTGWLARILIPVGLWFWKDINDAVDILPGKLAFAYRAWRWAMAFYCAIGTVFGLQFLPCVVGRQPACTVLAEVPLAFKELLHRGVPVNTLGFWGILGLAVYVLYFGVFLTVGLPRTGRFALRG